MNFLRRLRFAWAVLCLIAATLCAISLAAGSVPAVPWWLAASLAGAFSLYVSGSWFKRASCMWLGMVGCGAVGAGAMIGPQAMTQGAAITVGIWLTATVLLWLARGKLA